MWVSCATQLRSRTQRGAAARERVWISAACRPSERHKMAAVKTSEEWVTVGRAGRGLEGNTVRPMRTRWASTAQFARQLRSFFYSRRCFSLARFFLIFFAGNCFVCFARQATMYIKMFSPCFVSKWTIFSLMRNTVFVLKDKVS